MARAIPRRASGVVPARFESPYKPEDIGRWVELKLRGLSTKQISEAWAREVENDPARTASSTTIQKHISAHYAALAQEQRGQLAEARSEQSAILDQMVAVSTIIALGSRCSVCAGSKTVARDPLHKDLGQQVCPKCEGSGRNEADGVRLAAANTVKGLLERKAKLMGLDAPTQVQADHALSVALDVTGISDEALASELEDLFRSPDLEGYAVELPEAEPGTIDAAAELERRTTDTPLSSSPPAPPPAEGPAVVDQG